MKSTHGNQYYCCSGKENKAKRMVGPYKRMAIVVHTCNPSTPKAGAGGSQVQGQPGLRRDPVSQRQHAA